jgi:shikimate kinase
MVRGRGLLRRAPADRGADRRRGRTGWEGFRELEQRELARVLDGASGLVLAAGGGVVEREANRARLREGARCVWLREDLDVLRERLRRDTGSRPALGGADPVSELDEVAARREPLYREIAELAVDAGARAPAEIAREIARLLAGP